ncbi:MAG: hypothetical protein NTV23_05910 [Propionibacteriales bacterium]|nr:hypothetical protein [Propionibacteriales bacterium]
MRALGTALVLALLVAVGGCGSDDKSPATKSDRPTAEQLAAGLKRVNATSTAPYTDEEALCVGQVFRDSKLSDESLRQVEADLLKFQPPAAEEAIYRNLVPSLATCLSRRLTAPTASPSS